MFYRPRLKFYLTFSVILLTQLQILAQSKEEKAREAHDLTQQAIGLMDNGNYEESIRLLEKAEKLDPKNSDITYEKAFAYYLQQDFKKAIEVGSALIKSKSATDQYFQILGNSYDYSGNPDAALETYEKGIKKFPNSGALYLERGILFYAHKKYDEAINSWENGVAANPKFSSNYYWLGKIYSYTDSKIWSVLYGEMFMNLERATKRTEEMSQINYNVHQACIKFKGDTSIVTSYVKEHAINLSKNDVLKFPFSLGFEMSMGLSSAIGLIENKADTTITLEMIYKIRNNFIDSWFESDLYAKNYPNILFDYQRKIKSAGHYKAYTYWLYSIGRPDEFDTWYDANTAEYNAFADWFTENYIEVTKENMFSRTRL